MTAGHYLLYRDQNLYLDKERKYLIGRAPDNDIVLDDESVSRHHAVLAWGRSAFQMADRKSTNGTWVNGSRISTIRLLDGDGIRIGNTTLRYLIRGGEEPGEEDGGDTILIEKRLAELEKDLPSETRDKVRDLKQYITRKRDALARMAFRDTLTGLHNRRYFDEKLDEEITRAKRYDRALSLILVDIDHFQAYNDTWGHQKGDEVLAAVAGILKSSCRSSDIVARYGGEEMVFILPETDASRAVKLAEKARHNIEVRTEAAAGQPVTVSLGVAGLGPGTSTASSLIAAADRALYRAKEQGRNRVVTAED